MISGKAGPVGGRASQPDQCDDNQRQGLSSIVLMHRQSWEALPPTVAGGDARVPNGECGAHYFAQKKRLFFVYLCKIVRIPAIAVHQFR